MPAAPIRNQPIRASHSPPKPTPARNCHSPSPISTAPSTQPARAATTDAFVRSPVAFHTAARSSRPPSSGAAGSALKTASSTLMPASQASEPSSSPSTPATASTTAIAPKKSPISRLTSGPTPAMRSSAPGSRASPRSSATPPKSQRVIPPTSSPLRLATIACDTSWASRPRKKTTAAASPARTYAATGRSG